VVEEGQFPIESKILSAKVLRDKGVESRVIYYNQMRAFLVLVLVGLVCLVYAVIL
jgi:hypothetical protein